MSASPVAPTPSTTTDAAPTKPVKKASNATPALPPRETRQTAAASSSQLKPIEDVPLVPTAALIPREPVWNPHLDSLPLLDFPNESLRPQLQPDDLQDETLMLCARALAMCANRALCPKEIAEVMMFRGWHCSGTQPFAIVSTCIRKHLQRRGFGITNASHGKPARPGLAPPLFASYELTGPPLSLTAIGIDPNAKPAVKRGTLWYLSEEGTGLPSPFGELDPNRHASNLPEPPKPKAAPVPRRPSAPAMPSAKDLDYAGPSTSARSARQDSPEDSLAMGRGKRKRKVSGIAGGDQAWHASARPGLPSLDESDESVPPTPVAPSAPPPDKAASGIRKIRVRLGSDAAPPPPALATALSDGPVLCHKVDTEDEMSDVEALQQRRFKKRSKSEGSLLSLTASAPRPASPSPLQQQQQQQHTSLWSAFRSNGGRSATTSVASTDLRLERLEEMDADEAAADDDATAAAALNLAVPDTRRPRGDDEQDDFHESMLKGDFDLDFDFALRAAASVGHSPEAYYSTPATTPRSWSGSIRDALDADLYAQAAANHKSGVGAPAPILLDVSGAPAADVTLADGKLSASASSDSLAAQGLSSPAPDLPALPLESAAKTMGFAPALGGPDAVDAALSPSAGPSRAPSVFSSRSFSPASPFASPPASSREPTPLSDSSDSFDAELVVKSEPSPDEYAAFDSASPIPPFDDEDTFGAAGYDDAVEPFVGIPNLDLAELDLVRWGPATAPSPTASSSPSPKREPGRKLRSGKTTGGAGFFQAVFGSPSSPSAQVLPPTPFGPEVFGFTAAPLMDWKPLSSISCSPEERFAPAQEISLDMIAAPEETSQETAKPRASSEPAEGDVEMEDAPAPATAPPPPPALVPAAAPTHSPPSSKTRAKGKEERPPAPASPASATATPAPASGRRTSSRLCRK